MLRVFGQMMPREVVFLALGEQVLGSFAVYWLLLIIRGGTTLTITPPLLDIALLLSLVFGVAAAIAGLYRAEFVFECSRLSVKCLGAASLSFVLMALCVHSLALVFGGILAVSAATRIVLPLAWLGCLAVTRRGFSLAVRHKVLVRRIVVVASASAAARLKRFIAGGRCRHLTEVELIEWADPQDADLSERLAPEKLRRERIWGIVVGSGAMLPADLLLRCRLSGIRVFGEAAFWEREGAWIDVDGADHSWLFDQSSFRQGRVAAAIKRGLDLIIALVLILLTLPLMLVIATLITLESPGPALYRQERVGRHGSPFTLYKFRSMRADAEAPGEARWATVGDPRITRVGRLIRYTRIDELPQLFNVLRGDMSVVGPRPERPYFVGKLAAELPCYAQRHFVKPGITGWAQVNAPYGASIEDALEKLRYDLYYVKNCSPILDLWILFCTVRVIVFQEGAR